MVRTVTDAPLADRIDALHTGEQSVSACLRELQSTFESIEPTVRAFLDEERRWERIRRRGSWLETRFPAPGERPPLYGIPVGVKDNFHVEGFDTRAGSDVPPEALTGQEASVVTALEDAGAVVLGKTVLPEFSHFAPGPTRNPHDTDHTPGGSSSGSAAAVAAGLCPLALGTQVIGSVIRPAAFCGVVGVKPSFERVPSDGTVSMSPSLSHVGYFTQDVTGARRAAGVIYDDWRSGADPSRLETIGAVDGPYLEQASQEARDHFRIHLDDLEAAGYEVRRLELFPDIEDVNERHKQLFVGENALSHSEWYSEYGDLYAAETAELIGDGTAVSVPEMMEGRVGRFELRRRIHEGMDDAGVDVIVSPAAPGPAPRDLGTTGDPIMNLPWTHAGVPTVTIPASKTEDGLPMGLQCVTRFGEDESLLDWCGGIESAV